MIEQLIDKMTGLLALLYVAFLTSCIFSFICFLGNGFGKSVCTTKAYYLPATFIMCNLQEPR